MSRATKIRMFLLGIVLAAATSTATYAAKCVPNPDAICPLIFAPVTCNNGVTYSNQCFANADCAKGCRPA